MRSRNGEQVQSHAILCGSAFLRPGHFWILFALGWGRDWQTKRSGGGVVIYSNKFPFDKCITNRTTQTFDGFELNELLRFEAGFRNNQRLTFSYDQSAKTPDSTTTNYHKMVLKYHGSVLSTLKLTPFAKTEHCVVSSTLLHQPLSNTLTTRSFPSLLHSTLTSSSYSRPKQTCP